MDPRTLECLQWPDVIGHVAGFCQSPRSAALIRSIEPATTLEEVEARIAPVAQGIDLLDGGIVDLSLAALEDPEPLWEAVGPVGHSLEPRHLFAVAGFLELLRLAESWIRAVRTQAPALAALAEGLQPASALERELRRCINADGSLSDTASPELARLRSELRRAEQRIHIEVQKLTDSLHKKGVLQDSYSTIRDGRYVVPVKPTHRRQVQGIVHGASKTGETLFVEPAPILEMANDIEELRGAEAREVHRICLALTERVRPHVPAFRADTQRLTVLDAALARVRLARTHRWNFPQVFSAGQVRLLEAHHPLLHLRRPESSVAVRLTLESTDRVIVVSGPNAGGKTTLLKTLGLAVLLVQCGIPAPLSPDSRMVVFGDVRADIGDAQDVAEGRSTFSAHARRLGEIAKFARERTLVLLDELGTATDPVEGAAIAEALLEILRRRGGITLATSHLTPLKQWAHGAEGARNASFALDPRTQMPTFHLALDIPGTSDALVIAEREGVPEEVLALARRRMDRGETDLTALLRSLAARERAIAENERALASRLQALAEQEALASRRADELREERRRAREAAARDRAAELARQREEIEKRIAALPPKDAPLAQQRRALVDARRETEGEQRQADLELRLSGRAMPAPLAASDLQAGSEVYVMELRETGVVQQLDGRGERVRVLLDRGLVVEARIEGLARSQAEVAHLEAMRREADRRAVRYTAAVAAGADPDDDDAGGGAVPRTKKSKKVKKALEDDNAPVTTFVPGVLAGRLGGAARRGPEAFVVGARKADPQGAPPAATAKSASKLSDLAEGLRRIAEQNAQKAASVAAQKAAAGSGGIGAGPRAVGKSGTPVSGAGARGAQTIIKHTLTPRGEIRWQIDLHGMRVEEALAVVDRYLDDAVLADMPFVKICHGIGTGALAKAVREFLDSHPHAAAWRIGQPEEGGTGVTVVDLR